MTVENCRRPPAHLGRCGKDASSVGERIRQCLAATPAHGAVSVLVGARAAWSDELDRGRRVADAMSPLVITIEVRDTGCGDPEADVQKAFEPFFTTKAVGKGTGLGLILSRETVLAQWRRLVLESETDRGTDP